MSKPNAILAEPLTLGSETVARERWGSGKALLLSSLLAGFALAVFIRPVLVTRSEVDTPAISMRGAFSGASASPMSMSCPRPAAVSVNAMQQALRKVGVPPSPMEKFALTSYAATRDVSLAAQAKEEFQKLDHLTQSKLKMLSKDIVVRAASLKPEEMAGITNPLGFWDPAGLSKKGNLAAYRAAELKHGRVCMLASLGIMVTEVGYHPFYDNWGDAPFVSAAASHFSATAGEVFWPAFWVMAAGHELATELSGGYTPDPKLRAPGDFGFDPLNLSPPDPEEFKALQNKELNNGRLAMAATAGILAQELITGKKIF
jgi:hypothetical protein